MKGVPQGRYTREFRQEAVKLVTEERLSLPEAARRLSLAPSTLGYWVKAQRAGKLGDVGKTYRPLTEVEMDLARTKKELAEVKMERDILNRDSPDQTNFPGYSSFWDTVKYNPAFQGRQMRPNSLKFPVFI